MHVDKPQRPRLGHAMNKLHLTSCLTFSSNQSIQEAPYLSISHGYTNQNFSPTLLSFLLRKELGSSLKSLLSNPRVHTLKESKTPSHFFFTLSQRNQKTQETLFLSHAYRSNTKKKENSLKLSTSHTFGSSHQEREILSCKRDSIPIFPSRTINLVKVLATLTLESMISSRNFSNGSLWFVKL